MSDWQFVQQDPSERLAKVEFFSFEKEGEEFIIYVKEFVSPPDPSMKFIAGTETEVNRRTAPFKPVGWGSTQSEALRACLHEIRKFPLEG